MQVSTGAWNASFNSYPDEPAHLVGSVMVRDYLATGHLTSPRTFAENYYQRYPYFGIGIWPPLFYLITAVWFLIAGVGRMQALMVVGAATAGTAALICGLVRRRAGFVAGFCAGLLFLSLPDVQRWMCAVVADNVVTFFCVAAAACLIRYFERASLLSALGFALFAGCAILTKYTAWFLFALPFASLLALRRFELLKKPVFWLQPVVLAAVVAPWTIWTWRFITRVPGWPLGSLVVRLENFSRVGFLLLPPVLAAAITLGLVLIIVKRQAWKPDLTVLGLLSLGLLSYLSIAPPAGAEGRYLLPAAAAALVLAFAGWHAAIEPLASRGGLWTKAVPAFSLALALPFAVTHFGVYNRPPQNPIRSIVETISANRAWDGKQILLAPDVEGPIVAQFALTDRRPPGHWLRRPSKVLASCNWYGDDYSSRFHSAQELSAWLARGPVDLIIWHRRRASDLRPHEIYLGQVLGANPSWLRKAASFDSATWELYEYVPPATQAGQSATSSLPTSPLTSVR